MAAGDHIVVRAVGYTHHGIDLGDGTVVHFNGGANDENPVEALRQKAGARVIRSTLEEFVNGREYWYHSHQVALPADDVCQRALSRLGEAGYHLVQNNCEHFANWCKTGTAISRQVNAYRHALQAGAARALATGSTARALGTTTAQGLLGALARGLRPLGLAADAAQLATTLVAQQRGLPAQHAQHLGRGVGLTGNVLVGALAAGPAGAGVAAAFWGVCELISLGAPSTGKLLKETAGRWTSIFRGTR